MPRNRPPRPRIRPGHRTVVPTPAPDPGEVDIDAAVAEINRIYITGGLKTTVAVGRFILDTFFGGDIVAFSSKGPGWPSFAELHQRHDLAMSYSVLSYSVQVAHQVRQLPQDIAWKLNISHHRVLVRVKDLDVKTEFARLAVEEGLHTKELKTRVYRAIGADPSRPGRTQLSPPALAVRRLERKSREFVREMGRGGLWDRVPDEEQADVVARLERTIRRLERVRDGLEQEVDGGRLEAGEPEGV
jgi:hypothetical protein